MSKNFLIIIVGPTAIGKTALSIKLANHFGSDILSCDSRQFFKEMKIGTAVPNAEELAAANHHFIQNKSIFENYSVGDFEKEAISKLEDLFRENNVQIVVGGSGLYVNAILHVLMIFLKFQMKLEKMLEINMNKKD
jgi:tRNA dimethylallyltransferase